jgi:Transposase, Mutator family
MSNVTDGCPGLAAAIQTVYPRIGHQRCWVHKMRSILEHVRKRDYDEVKRGAQAIYRADSRAQAQAAFPQLPGALAAGVWAYAAATGARPAGTAVVLRVAPALVEEGAHHQRHRTLLRGSSKKNPAHGLLRQRAKRRPHHRIIYSIFQRSNLEWKNRTLNLFTQAA